MFTENISLVEQINRILQKQENQEAEIISLKTQIETLTKELTLCKSANSKIREYVIDDWFNVFVILPNINYAYFEILGLINETPITRNDLLIRFNRYLSKHNLITNHAQVKLNDKIRLMYSQFMDIPVSNIFPEQDHIPYSEAISLLLDYFIPIQPSKYNKYPRFQDYISYIGTINQTTPISIDLPLHTDYLHQAIVDLNKKYKSSVEYKIWLHQLGDSSFMLNNINEIKQKEHRISYYSVIMMLYRLTLSKLFNKFEIKYGDSPKVFDLFHLSPNSTINDENIIQLINKYCIDIDAPISQDNGKNGERTSTNISYCKPYGEPCCGSAGFESITVKQKLYYIDKRTNYVYSLCFELIGEYDEELNEIYPIEEN